MNEVVRIQAIRPVKPKFVIPPEVDEGKASTAFAKLADDALRQHEKLDAARSDPTKAIEVDRWLEQHRPAYLESGIVGKLLAFEVVVRRATMVRETSEATHWARWCIQHVQPWVLGPEVPLDQLTARLWTDLGESHAVLDLHDDAVVYFEYALEVLSQEQDIVAQRLDALDVADTQPSVDANTEALRKVD